MRHMHSVGKTQPTVAHPSVVIAMEESAVSQIELFLIYLFILEVSV